MKRRLIMIVVGLALVPGLKGRQQDHEADRLARAAQVIKTVMGPTGPSIPAQLANRALCIGIIPSAMNIELGLGAHFGRGVLVCRVNDGKSWSSPWMFTVGGASYGLIPEGDSSNVVFLVMTRQGRRKFMGSSLRVGEDASETPGTVAGRAGITSITVPQSDLIGYSIRQGKFSGASLYGVVIKPDDEANFHLYGRHVEPAEVLTNSSFAPPAAARLLEQMLAEFCMPSSSAALAKY
jgi:lipid-binding SYLF domain-containing protein